LFSKGNNYKDNYNYLFPSSNFSVEIPISNIMPAFFESKQLLVSSISPRKKNLNYNSNNNLIIRRSKTKCGNAVYNNFINKNDKISESENNENQNYINVDMDNANKNKIILRRTKEFFRNKRTKDRKKKIQIISRMIKDIQKKVIYLLILMI
jgi:hypothetical protein